MKCKTELTEACDERSVAGLGLPCPDEGGHGTRRYILRELWFPLACCLCCLM